MCDALLPHSCPLPIFASSQESTVRVPPKFNGVLKTSVAVWNTPVLCKEIAVLLAKDAIEPVPPAEMRQGLPGAYGIRSCSHTARIASYETTTALATLPGPEVGMAPWYTASGYHPAVSPLNQPLDRPCLSTGWGAPRTSVPSDASSTGWGATCNGHAASGLWTGPRMLWHINCLELWAVHLALLQFRPPLLGKHVLVRTDNTVAVSYINRLGGLRSHRMSQLAHHLLLWSHMQFKSLRAVHITG